MDEHSRRENGIGGKASQNKSVERNELMLLMCLSATKDRMEKKCESVRFDETNYSRRGESDGVNARDCENKLARR